MNRRRYWKNRIPFLLTNLVCMAALTVFLLVCGNSISAVLLILVVWAVVLLTGLFLTYWKRKRQMQKLLDIAGQLSERYLISEVMELPEQAEDQVYYQLLKMAGKSMLEQIGEVRRERLEYKEYIEQWIHEIKTPITSARLICRELDGDTRRKLTGELARIEEHVERALFYARAESPERDCVIRQTDLVEIVAQAVGNHRSLLIQSGVRVETEGLERSVYTDEKWAVFILGQLLQNAARYRGEEPVVTVSARSLGKQVQLTVADNGMGIPTHELPRVFGRGFTGSNGRARGGSTGMGLYLCKKLAGFLELGLDISSVEGEGTAVTLTFPTKEAL